LPEFLRNLNFLANKVLKSAINTGHKVLIKLLIMHNNVDIIIKESGQTPLLWAVEKGHKAVVKLLLKKGAELETKDVMYGWTALLCAAEKGHKAVVKLLLEKGAELETRDRHSQTPLSQAVKKGHKAVVKLLQEKRAQAHNNS
jgi:ankyrin repeat protein